MSSTRPSVDAVLPDSLIADITRAGYFPDLVNDVVATALGEQQVRSHLVHAETTLDAETVRRHITVMVLTEHHLLIIHADDHAPGPDSPTEHLGPIATATSETVPLRAVRGVMLTHVVEGPEHYRSGSLGREITVTIGWGTVSRIDLLPATCGDPQCEADHGYEGTLTADDIALRISADADGQAVFDQARDFAAALSAAIGR